MKKIDEQLRQFIVQALAEDSTDPSGKIPPGDHSSIATIPTGANGRARLLIKEDGIIAGIEAAKEFFFQVDESMKINVFIEDGAQVKKGDIAFTVEGSVRNILLTERPLLNTMQRMSGIATTTSKYVEAVAGTGVTLLDTRKTTPGLRFLEKEAVRLGGGKNHRIGLYDMIMLKDNHVDYAGGIEKALDGVQQYLKEQKLQLKVEIEARTLEDVQKVLDHGGADRIMFDNFTVEMAKKASEMVGKRMETEISGGITLETIRSYAETGVDFISVGALTHTFKSLDLSLKAF